jgi:hypothetical protein
MGGATAFSPQAHALAAVHQPTPPRLLPPAPTQATHPTLSHEELATWLTSCVAPAAAGAARQLLGCTAVCVPGCVQLLLQLLGPEGGAALSSEQLLAAIAEQLLPGSSEDGASLKVLHVQLGHQEEALVPGQQPGSWTACCAEVPEAGSWGVWALEPAAVPLLEAAGGGAAAAVEVRFAPLAAEDQQEAAGGQAAAAALAQLLAGGSVRVVAQRGSQVLLDQQLPLARQQQEGGEEGLAVRCASSWAAAAGLPSLNPPGPPETCHDHLLLCADRQAILPPLAPAACTCQPAALETSPACCGCT